MARRRGGDNRKKGESFEHYDAFEFWYFLVPRDFTSVAKEFKVSVTSVCNWARRFKWEQRAQERDEKLKQAIAARHDSEAIKARTRIIEVADKTIERFMARLEKDPQKRLDESVTLYEPTAVDAARMAQLKLLLTGQATNRTELSLGKGVLESFVSIIGAVLKKELPHACPHCKTALELSPRLAAAMAEAAQAFQRENMEQATKKTAPAADPSGASLPALPGPGSIQDPA